MLVEPREEVGLHQARDLAFACPNCGAGELKIIAAILRGEPGRKRS